ncbi:MAG: CDP-diacylglycerol--glycerol-3-phosphate 3-phosphatidyltransferase [Gimesia sp.]|jgi:CDP-diacylglycerol--glycerol-3-phosphate 3-phosphatidyltransferase|uniref:CDP-diacylglycerol--glycerol-3-phosphate 3-phosphatidyltransferase n=1 Tax=Gimesia chilikensis TaxID=2605989 RepID=A0A517WDD0_9PLAN|nr:CDP-diacylglycerol--glycerol-3-phosphate 3-phosphatidyltransferase [Gimesia chilikensis]MBN70017.1 CDP-diacylglycerol--glycerol-3-phosphate 3-phosphatidyltransferase [Gimesia sp.]QDT21106.1 CDP-diacylglycerol--glycerol-3-phosphate 3-phosphatidyltransferase [Gimesia chilikensis]QDU03265.1 CDP-diacylglycerol--glycerol-3-phosphate 3-phosphatidyltransferase [Gimesia chilikensis]
MNSTSEPQSENTGPGTELLGPEIWNLPNLITVSRLVLSLILFVIIYLEGWWKTSACLFIVAAATDFLDGYFARKYNQVTTLGRIMDPFVDKFIICGAFIFLLERGSASGINAWFVLIIIGREMFITSLRGFLEKRGRDFSASWSGKIKMGVQCVAVVVSLLSLSPEAPYNTPGFLMFRDVTIWATALITLYSGIDYVLRASRMLKRNPL